MSQAHGNNPDRTLSNVDDPDDVLAADSQDHAILRRAWRHRDDPDPDRPRLSETLPGHIGDVGRVAAELVRDRGPALLAALGLSAEDWRGPLAAAVVRGALVHDIGKANAHFQRMVRRQTRLQQALRHEVVGLWIIAELPQLHRWLFQETGELVRYTALRAVVGHHLKFKRFRSLTPAETPELVLPVLTAHPDFASTLAAIGKLLDLGRPPTLADLEISLLDNLTAVNRLLREADAWWANAPDETRRFAAAVAALVVSADVRGSIFGRTGLDPVSWAGDALGTVCTAAELAEAATRRLNGADPRPFQQAVAVSPTRLTLVTDAPTSDAGRR